MDLLKLQQEEFIRSHIGPDAHETQEMLRTIGVSNMQELIDRTVPGDIRWPQELNVPPSTSESDYFRELKEISLKNKIFKSYIGQGYYDTITPSVILRNIFENPGW